MVNLFIPFDKLSLNILLMVSFVVHKLFNLICFCFFYFDKRLKKIHQQDHCQGYCHWYFLLGVWWFQSFTWYIQVFIPFWVDFYVRYKVEISFIILFVTDFPNPLIEKTLFPHYLFLLLCHKSICSIHGFTSGPIDLCIYFVCQYHDICDYCNFCNVVDFRQHDPLVLFFFIKTALGVFLVLYKFWDCLFCFCEKGHQEFWYKLHWICRWLWMVQGIWQY